MSVRNKIQSSSSIDLLLGVGADARSASDAGGEITLKAGSNGLSYNRVGIQQPEPTGGYLFSSEHRFPLLTERLQRLLSIARPE